MLQSEPRSWMIRAIAVRWLRTVFQNLTQDLVYTPWLNLAVCSHLFRTYRKRFTTIKIFAAIKDRFLPLEDLLLVSCNHGVNNFPVERKTFSMRNCTSISHKILVPVDIKWVLTKHFPQPTKIYILLKGSKCSE